MNQSINQSTDRPTQPTVPLPPPLKSDTPERVEGSKTFNLPGERKLSLTPAYDNNAKAFELSVAQVCFDLSSLSPKA